MRASTVRLVGELVDDVAALRGSIDARQPPLRVDDELDGQGTAHGLVGRRGDGLVVGVGVEGVAVVVVGAAPAGSSECR